MHSYNLKYFLLVIFSIFNIAHANQCATVFLKETINQFEMQLLRNDFTVNRDFSAYSEAFSSFSLFNPFGVNFKKNVKSLPRDSVWIDMGAGNAYAIIEAVYGTPQIRGVAVSYKKPDRGGMSMLESNIGERFKYLDGEYVEDMASKGRLDPWVGKTALITDFYGPFSYASDVAKIMQINLDLLSQNGQLYIFLSNQKTKLIRDGSSRYLSLLDWLTSIPGIEVKLINKRNAKTDIPGKDSELVSLQIIKRSPHVEVPQNLTLKSIEPGAPVFREYIWN